MWPWGRSRELGSELDGPRVLSWGGGVRRTTIGLRNRGAEFFSVVYHLHAAPGSRSGETLRACLRGGAGRRGRVGFKMFFLFGSLLLSVSVGV